MRAPREDELRLMRLLLNGPARIEAGPIGRCVKRGWCRLIFGEASGKQPAPVFYALTEMGRMLVGPE